MTYTQLTLEQKALLGDLTPVELAAEFICELDPQALARQILSSEIKAAEKNGNGVEQQWDCLDPTLELLTWKRLRRCSRQDARIVQGLPGKDAKSRLHIKAQLLLKPSMRSTVFAIRG